MAEIKHGFTAGKMNKDLDERLIPNGEYRDAMNIQVRTTDGDAAGTVQNIQGNKTAGFAHQTTALDDSGRITKAVGSVADEKNNKAYFLFCSPPFIFNASHRDNVTSETKYIDTIMEQDANGTARVVAVDVFAIVETYTGAGSPAMHAATTGFSTTSLTVSNGAKYRVGMTLQGYDTDGVKMFPLNFKVTKIDGNTLTFNKEFTALAAEKTPKAFFWTHPKALGFDYNKKITGINVIDNLLFYTTNSNEPRKINITRCKSGTVNKTTHTKLKLNRGSTGSLIDFTQDPGTTIHPQNKGDLLEEHITVIRKAPRLKPVFTMSDNERGGEGISDFTMNLTFLHDDTTMGVGAVFIFSIPDHVEGMNGDTATLTCTNSLLQTPPVVRIRIEEASDYDGYFVAEILSKSSNITAAHTEWLFSFESGDKPMFELKFPRFAYRYKYNDNEYSSFSPWSEIAFLPGNFDYAPKKGYNLGMVNNLQRVVITNLMDDQRCRPDDVKSIDILCKTTDSEVVYVIKTITKDVDPEWDLTGFADGNVVITSDMMHKAIPNNQFLRVWDNVPKIAKAQDIVSNRLMYGNYTQGYDCGFNVGLDAYVTSTSASDYESDNFSPNKSIKSLRSYKVGMVFGDKYGRETPVLATGKRSMVTNLGTKFSTDDSFSVKKSDADKVNCINVKQNWGSSTDSKALKPWMDYVKYYVKQPSGEYYNLAMDRWYNAKDGNVWISFPSADRNKVDDETYLILKTKNNESTLVTKPARYKVIAISNEAPEFIKSDRRPMGTIKIAEQDIPSNGSSLLQTNETFHLIGNSWENYLGAYKPVGTLKVRIKASIGGDVVYTPYKKVSRISPPFRNASDEYEDGSFTIADDWDNAADIPSLMVTAYSYANEAAVTSNSALVYEWEFLDDVKVNKPEFDGRFFVKLLRDLAIEEDVMDLSAAEYEPLDSWTISYLKGVGTHPTPSGSIDPDGNAYSYNSGNYNWAWGVAPNSLPNYQTNNSNAIATVALWQDINDYTDSGVQTGIFIDAMPLQAMDTNFGTPSIGSHDGYYDPANGATAHGFSRSGNATPGTYDRLFFSRLILSTEVTHEDWVYFEEKFTTINTMFRFADDPNGTLYRIIGGSGTAILKSSDHPSGVPSWSWNDYIGYRDSFFTTFRRVDADGTVTDDGINFNHWDPRGVVKHDGRSFTTIQTVGIEDLYEGDLAPSSKASVFETEPKESAELDIYYEASNPIPLKLNYENTGHYAPKKSAVQIKRNGVAIVPYSDGVTVGETYDSTVQLIKSDGAIYNDVTSGTVGKILVGDEIYFKHADGTVTKSEIKSYINSYITNGIKKSISSGNSVLVTSTFGSGSTKFETGLSNSSLGINEGDSISGPGLTGTYTIFGAGAGQTFFTVEYNGGGTAAGGLTIPNNSTFIIGAGSPSGYYEIDSSTKDYSVKLPWSNCYSFGNGVESDRIQDDFNAPIIGNGFKASTVLLDYGEEHMKSSIIYSGVYNSSSKINDLNEFNMSENIVKDINPEYGSIQALKTRDTDVTVLAEDKILKVLANKDALFNADGTKNLTATKKVLGQAIPYVGDYGISKNPESLAADQFRMYFTDKQRGAVLRLSRDGLTPISNVGMKSWFRDNLTKSNTLLGTFDVVNGEYNVSLGYNKSLNNTDTTISFNEAGKGWVSFKSFVPDAGVSVGGEYLTSKQDKVYIHHRDYDTIGADIPRNKFYANESIVNSHVNVIFNDVPGSVKNFKSLSYEGSDGKQIAINKISGTTASGVAYTDFSNSNYSVIPTIGTDLTSASSQVISTGWSFSSINTDLQDGQAKYVKGKEGKWFSDVNGLFNKTDIDSIDESEINVLGLGIAAVNPTWTSGGTTVTLTIDGNG